MPEVRIDPLTGYRVIVATGATATPADVVPAAPASDPLAQPPFTPVLTRDAPEPEPSAHPDLFWAGPAVGAHELIELGSPVGAPVSSIGELSVEEAVAAADRRREGMRAHADASCLHLYADERPG